MRRGWATFAIAFLLFGIAGTARAETFSKDILSVRDPFKQPTLSAPSVSAGSELEQWTTEQFRFLGVVVGGPGTRAMLMAPNGKTYFVKERTRIGQRKGVIVRITDDEILVRERFVNVLGQEEIADVPIRLPAEDQKK